MTAASSPLPINLPTAQAPRCAPPLAHTRAPRQPLPALACDSHLHILGPDSRYPYSDQRVYTPEDCLSPDYARVQQALGLQRCVLVQPSVYAQDNSVLLQALRDHGDAARGVAVIGAQTSAAELAAMHALGVRGVRVNLVDVREPDARFPIDALLRLEERILPLHWHIELLVHVDAHPDLDTQLARLSVPVVFGHMGYLSRGASVQSAGLQAMVQLAQAARAWIKLTGPYRLGAAPFGVAGEIARRLVGECCDRLVWGSDWPHVMVQGAMPDDGDLMDLLFDWVPDANDRRSILVDNPAVLYGWV